MKIFFKFIFLMLAVVLAAGFAYASEAVEASEALSTESLSENSVEAEITPWLNPVEEKFLDPELLANTEVTWIENVSFNDIRFQLQLANALSDAITLPYTLVNASTTSQSIKTTGTFIYPAGKQTGPSIILSVFSVSEPFSLNSTQTDYADGTGHVTSAFFQSDTTYCNVDNSFTLAIIEEITDEFHCSYITADELASITGAVDFSSQSTPIATIPVLFTESLSAVTSFDLSGNNLTAIPKNLFENHANPQNVVSFNIDDNPLTNVGDPDYNENGWEITNATWQEDGTGYSVTIDHALPEDLTISINLTGATVGDSNSNTGTVEIEKGSTTSSVIDITVLPIDEAPTVTFEPTVSQFSTWGGHINTTSFTFLHPEDLFANGICDVEATFQKALVDLFNKPCEDINLTTISDYSNFEVVLRR